MDSLQGAEGAEMKLKTAYIIAASWLIKTYKYHTNDFIVETSNDHIRYLFYYDGEALPFFTLHVMKNEGLIKEFVRFNGELKLHRIGHPAILISNDLCLKWTGCENVQTFLDREMSILDLYLENKPVVILWD